MTSASMKLVFEFKDGSVKQLEKPIGVVEVDRFASTGVNYLRIRNKNPENGLIFDGYIDTEENLKCVQLSCNDVVLYTYPSDRISSYKYICNFVDLQGRLTEYLEFNIK